MEAEFIPLMYNTLWALVPPVVAIVLALITKEVYSSLFVGVAVGGLIYSFTATPVKYLYMVHPVTALEHVFKNGSMLNPESDPSLQQLASVS